jgi:lipid-A-disaccharide synthase
MLAVMLSVSVDFDAYQFVIAGAPSIDVFYHQFLKNKNIALVSNQTYDLLANATAALVNPPNLETALFKVLEVFVC